MLMTVLSQNQIAIHSFAETVYTNQTATYRMDCSMHFFGGSMRKLIGGVFNSGPRVKINVNSNTYDFCNMFSEQNGIFSEGKNDFYS